MTPTALTPAGRGVRRSAPRPAAKRAPTKSAVAQGARTAAQVATERPTAARGKTRAVARRPPVSSAVAGGRSAGHRSSVTRSTLPRAPRRISGPVRPSRTRPRQQPVVREPLTRCAAFVRALPDHTLLDRIIRGRYWIPLLGILLVGIVAMQVEVLKLNAGIGRALEQSTSLQIRNEQLRAAVGRAADDQRIESTAAHMGMVMAPPAAIRFLERHPAADGAKAAGNIHAPNATGFQAALTAAAASTAASSAATVASATASPATGAGTSTSTGSSSTGA